MFRIRDQEMKDRMNMSYTLLYSDTETFFISYTILGFSSNIKSLLLRSNLLTVDDYYFHAEGKGYI